VRRHLKIIEELKKEHEDFLKGKMCSANISMPGEEPTGAEEVLPQEGYSFCGLKGHKTRNSKQCRCSTKPSRVSVAHRAMQMSRSVWFRSWSKVRFMCINNGVPTVLFESAMPQTSWHLLFIKFCSRES
jgi:hypothetical protein